MDREPCEQEASIERNLFANRQNNIYAWGGASKQ